MDRLKLIIVGFALLIFGCDELYEQPTTVYLIKKGEHSSNVEGSLPTNGFRSLKSETLTFTAKFDESARYDLKSKDQDDINKLFGFSDCNSHHQKNSARFGWNYNLETEMIDIYAYVYAQTSRTMQYLGGVKIGETSTYRLSLVGDSYEFDFNGSLKKIKRGADCDIGVYYLLFPYFGGNQSAPHDIRIEIQEIF